MTRHDSHLEPFDPDTLERIRTAFHAGWHELNNAVALPNPLELRNRLAGTIAILAQQGITDPFELKDQALQRVTSAATLN
jgi:hypothetical protein